MKSLNKIFTIKINSILFVNIIFFLYFILLEIYIGFNESSKSWISTHLIEGKLNHNYPLFGLFLQTFFHYLVNILNFFGLNLIISNVENFCTSLIFLISPILWIYLFNLKFKQDKRYLIIFIFLFLNPFFISFLHNGWRQSLAFIIFLLFWEISFKKIYSFIGSIISIIIHNGIIPLVSLLIFYEQIKSLKLKKYSNILLACLGIFLFYNYPFNPIFVPDFLPYNERLTLQFQYLPSYNDVDIKGSFNIKYYMVTLIPIIIISLAFHFNPFFFSEHTRDYNLILSGSFCILLLNFVPLSNRLLYFFIFPILIYGPIISYKTLEKLKFYKQNNIFKKINIEFLNYIILIVGHILTYLFISF